MKNLSASAKSTITRSQFLRQSGIAAAGLLLASKQVIGAPSILYGLNKPNSKFRGVQIGTITYSFRSLPTSAEEVLKYCLQSNVSAIELMGSTAEAFAGAPNSSTTPMAPYPKGPQPEPTAEQIAERQAKATAMATWRASASMEPFEKLRKMYKDAGVSIYAWKPNALGEKNTDAEIEYSLKVARALGASHVTVEIPNNPAQSKRLGDIAARHKVTVAYHGHTQQTFTAWDEALAQSKYNGVNIDIGHYVAAGLDPMEFLKSEKHERIFSMHVKDRKSKANGGDNMPWGQGDTPITTALQLLRDRKYKFPATVEMEYEVPEGSDAVKEVGKCVEFARKALES